jgi:tRNA 2-thiouridine synthesizing protein A
VNSTVDAKDLPCPLPIIRLAKAVRALAMGEVVQLLATDPGVEVDVPAWCLATGNRLLRTGREGAVIWVEVEKTAT